MAKKFNPKLSPYKQLLSHRGKAILTVVHRITGDISRIRAVSFKRDGLGGNYPKHSRWQHINHYTYDSNTAKFYDGSCFDNSGMKYKEVIAAMKSFDREDHLKIAHIEFYPA